MAKETHSPDISIDALDSVKVPVTGKFIRPDAPVFEPVDKPITYDYAKQLAFAEEPVTVILHPSGEEFAPMFRECWVNGGGAEILINGKWVAAGSLPVGTPVTTKRKFVEVFARSKHNTIRTVVAQYADREMNDIQRTAVQSIPFSVVKDANPLGEEWLQRLIRSAA
jgi:hypothetical protein